jgi:hypothetical protein
MHQSTVCRSLQLMQHQFKLEPRPGDSVCRHGHNACLQYLRLAYREHRLMEGLLRIGSDLLHQSLLMGISGVQLVPPRFRSGEHWAELVRHGLLDGAIMSSFCLEKLLLSGQSPPVGRRSRTAAGPAGLAVGDHHSHHEAGVAAAQGSDALAAPSGGVAWLWGGTTTDGLSGTRRLDQAGSGSEAGDADVR